MKKISGVTLTILTESPIALSNDQGYGNYTAIKKYFYKDGNHVMTSVATFTYELRKTLFEKFNWKLNDVTIKKSSLYLNNVEDTTNNGLESDIFGFLIPDKQISKTSPLRIIPFISMNTYKNDFQLITNRGFLNTDFGRKYFDEKGENITADKLPKTQALANEEVFGDYYMYTVTLELDRIGVIETCKEKYLLPNEKIYMAPELREKAVKDLLEALTILTRDIKHQKVHLKPLAVFGGAFERVVPYFWNDMEFDNDRKLKLNYVNSTIDDYNLTNVIVAIDERIGEKTELSPVKSIIDLSKKLRVNEQDNTWYLAE